MRSDDLGQHARHFEFVELAARRPNIAQEDRLLVVVVVVVVVVVAVTSEADRLALKVDVHSARYGVGDDERRRGQIVGTHRRVQAALEVAISAQNTDRNQFVLSSSLSSVSQSSNKIEK